MAGARLCLGAAWAEWGCTEPRLRTLAQRLAQGEVPVEVLVMPALAQPELRLCWAPWHAPPARARPAPPSFSHTNTPGNRNNNIGFRLVARIPRRGPSGLAHGPGRCAHGVSRPGPARLGPSAALVPAGAVGEGFFFKAVWCER